MPVSAPRTCLVNFRLTNEEHAQVKLAAKAAGARSLSEYARQAVMAIADTGAETKRGMEDLQAQITNLQSRVAKLEGYDPNAPPIDFAAENCLEDWRD